MTWEDFEELQVPERIDPETRRRYSVTADVLSFRLCPRQYCFNAQRGYIPSQPTQQFVGTIIHQVLDRAHSHYMGRVDQSTKGLMPTDEDIDEYFTEVETSLLAHGIRAISPETRDHTLKLIQAFNRIEGPILYPRIIDTEHRLQSERGEYLLYGVVDVLASSERPLGSSGTEIWDYKGTRKPKAKRVAGSRRLRDYEFQMQVYSELYRQRNGNHPQRAVIYFIGELAGEPSKRPEDAMMTVNLDLVRIQNALVEFDTTVKAIRTCIEEDEWIPPTEGAGKETCDLCDTRWSCPSIGHQYREHRRYP